MSFCHAVLERFTQGLADAGHACEVVDLYAVKFDPVYGGDDFAFFAHESVPREIWNEAGLRERMVADAGGPLRRAVARRWLRDKGAVSAAPGGREAAAQGRAGAAGESGRADGLAFIAPIFWMNLPAILRGWVERVFTYGFVYTMTEDVWLKGDLSGRQPLLKHRKALIMTPTFFRECDYRDSGCGAAIERLVDDFGFRYPGIDVDPAGLSMAANVRVERFLPHAPLLERAACVVCHAGMGITQKALAHGVPVVAVPFGRDQPDVARRVEVARAGVRLPVRELTPGRLREAVRQALGLRPGAERIAAAFAAAGAPAAAAAAIEELVTTAPHVPALATQRRSCDDGTGADEGNARLTDRRTSIYL